MLSFSVYHYATSMLVFHRYLFNIKERKNIKGRWENLLERENILSVQTLHSNMFISNILGKQT